jgi:hypothetical protein
VNYSPLYFWIYEYQPGTSLLGSGSVHFKTLGGNAVGWTLSSNGVCLSQTVILSELSQERSTQIFLNSLSNNEDVYFGLLFLGTAFPFTPSSSSSSPASVLNQSSSSVTQIIETAVSYCHKGSLTECVMTPQGSATIPLNSSLFFIHYLLSSHDPSPRDNDTAAAFNRSDILVFTPFGDTDYFYAEDDIFTEDYSEPSLSTWDLVGIMLGIITGATLLLAMVVFYRSLNSSRGMRGDECASEVMTLSPLPVTEQPE